MSMKKDFLYKFLKNSYTNFLLSFCKSYIKEYKKRAKYNALLFKFSNLFSINFPFGNILLEFTNFLF